MNPLRDIRDARRWKHSHDFSGEFSAAEGSARRVLLLTVVMMAAEIFGGLKFRSMALFADGWHMGTHVAAFGITSLAYWLTRRNASNERYSFGTGKIGILGAFASAVILGGVAVYMAGESLVRLFTPEPIAFGQAIPIAAAGLLVNIISASMLKAGQKQPDLNLRAAYGHVVADVFTSVLAISALVLGRCFGWMWLDAAMGIVGSLVIAQWAFTLVRDTHDILVDCEPASSNLRSEIRKAIEAIDGTRIVDLHTWQVGVNKFSAIVSLVTDRSQPPEFYKTLLREHGELMHVTVEVNALQRTTRPRGRRHYGFGRRFNRGAAHAIDHYPSEPPKEQQMKIAISMKGESLESDLDPMFGRAPKFLLFDTETRGFTAHENTANVNAAQGAGIQAAESVIRLGADTVISGQVGPKAFKVLKSAGVRIFLAPDLRDGREAIGALERGELQEAPDESMGTPGQHTRMRLGQHSGHQ